MSDTRRTQLRRHRPRTHEVVLKRGRHVWSFRFAPGDAAGLRAHVSDLARDPAAPFDDVDAVAVRKSISMLESGAVRGQLPTERGTGPHGPPGRA